MLSRGLQLCSTPHDSLQSVNFHLSGPQERNFSFCRNTFLTRAFATWKKQQLLLWGTHNPLTGTLTTNIQRPSLWHSQLIMPVCFHSLSRPFQACILAALVPQFCANSCGVHLWPNGFCDVDEAFGVLIMSPTTCGMDWSLRHRCECQEEASYLQTVPQCLLIFHLPKAASCEYTKKRLTQNIMNELIQVPWSLAGQAISRIFCFCHKPLYADSMPYALCFATKMSHFGRKCNWQLNRGFSQSFAFRVACLVTKLPAAVLPFDFSSAQHVKKHFHGKNQWHTANGELYLCQFFESSVPTANGFVWVPAHRSKIMSLTKLFTLMHFGFVCPGLQPCRRVSCHLLSGGSVGVPCYLFNSSDVNAFNLQTLQCFAAQLVMVCCVTADSLLNKKHVKRTTLSMAVEASGAELKRACHRDSHS